jgi:hypothetical protein
VVVAASSGFGVERGDGGKLIDVKAGLNDGWTRGSMTWLLWKRWWAAPASELFGDCLRGGAQ